MRLSSVNDGDSGSNLPRGASPAGVKKWPRSATVPGAPVAGASASAQAVGAALQQRRPAARGGGAPAAARAAAAAAPCPAAAGGAGGRDGGRCSGVGACKGSRPVGGRACFRQRAPNTHRRVRWHPSHTHLLLGAGRAARASLHADCIAAHLRALCARWGCSSSGGKAMARVAKGASSCGSATPSTPSWAAATCAPRRRCGACRPPPLLLQAHQLQLSRGEC